MEKNYILFVPFLNSTTNYFFENPHFPPYILIRH